MDGTKGKLNNRAGSCRALYTIQHETDSALYHLEGLILVSMPVKWGVCDYRKIDEQLISK